MCLTKKADKKVIEPIDVEPIEVLEPVRFSNENEPKAKNVVELWIQRALEVGVASLLNEYRGLAKYMPPGATITAFQSNRDKNRYVDVYCTDASRVVLKFPGISTDYIHANHVATPSNPRRFICTQGPLEATQHAFWAMVLQENVECILMVCKCVEANRDKCAQYWPEEGTVTIGEDPQLQIQVTNVGVTVSEKNDGVIVTNLKVDWLNGSRLVRHFQWKNWPDHGVPKNNETVIELLSSTRGSKCPIVVHCSAGIGRSGSIIAVAMVLERMVAGQECTQMDELLKELRAQRFGAVQTEMQYLFVHRVLLYYFLERHRQLYQEILENNEMGEKYEKWLEDYNALMSK